MRYLLSVILMVSMSFLLVSCGQKGALYLPSGNVLENDVLTDKMAVDKKRPENIETDDKTRKSDIVPRDNQVDNNNLY